MYALTSTWVFLYIIKVRNKKLTNSINLSDVCFFGFLLKVIYF